MIKVIPASDVCEQIVDSFDTFIKDSHNVDDEGNCLLGKRDFKTVAMMTVDMILKGVFDASSCQIVVINDMTWFDKTDARIQHSIFFDIIYDKLKRYKNFIPDRLDITGVPNRKFDLTLYQDKVGGEFYEAIIPFYKSSLST